MSPVELAPQSAVCEWLECFLCNRAIFGQMVWPVELAPQSNAERRDGWAEFGPIRQAFRWLCLINVNVAFIAGVHLSAVILMKKTVRS